MKKISYFKLLGVLLFAAVLNNNTSANIKFETANYGDTIVIKIKDHVGIIHWQKIEKEGEWQTLSIGANEELLFVAKNSAYFRAFITIGSCTPFLSDTVFVGINTVPPRVLTSIVKSITKTSAICSGNVISDGGTPVTAKGLCWSIYRNPTITDSISNEGSGLGIFESNISGLLGNTVYFVRAYAINSEGISYGSEKIFKTSVTVPTIESTEVSSITQTSVVCGGNIINNGGKDITDLGVCWSPNPNPTLNDNKFVNELSSGNYSANIIGLIPGTTYYFRAYATNSEGTSYGEDICFSTLSATLPSISTNAISNITQNSAEIGGRINCDNGAEVISRGVCWSTSPNPYITDSFTNNGNGIGSFISIIHNLTINTTYYVKAYATNIAGTNYGDVVSFTTPSISIPKLSTKAVAAITQNSAESGGVISSNCGAEVTIRGVCWSTISNPTISNTKTSDGNGNELYSSNITGLDANTIYYVRAYATNSAGTNYGNEISFITPPTDIPKISTTSISNITANSAQSGGNISTDNGATITTRGVCWSTMQNPTIADNKTKDDIGKGEFNSTIEYLLPNTTYHLRAYATNSVGTNYGEEISFTTKSIDIPIINTGAISNISQNIAIGGGYILSNNGAEVTSRGLCWSTNHNPTIENNKTENGIGIGLFADSIKGLLASTTYYVKAYATNSVGINYGEEISFTTLDISVPIITFTETKNVTFNSATCSGNITGDGGTAITSRGICWGLNQNPSLSDSIIIEGLGLGSFSCIIKNLLSYTTYYARAFATNSQGTSYGSLISFTTFGAVRDAEGYIYNTVIIGEQEWMAENLKSLKYNDSTAIPLVSNSAQWLGLSTPAYCWYNNDSSTYRNVYGTLYNYYAVKTGKLCPTGWHVPSENDWIEIIGFLGGTNIIAGKLKETDTAHWKSPNTDATNEFSFNAVPGGWRKTDGTFSNIGSNAYWWTSSEYYNQYEGTKVWIHYAYYNYAVLSRTYISMQQGLSVRCIKD